MRGSFDACWKARVLSGDAEATQVLAEAMLEPLYRFCFYRVGRNRHRCEDVVQETLVIAILQIDRYDPGRADGEIIGWLTGLARNEIHRVLARDRSSVSLESLWERMDGELQKILTTLDSEPLPDELCERAETREMVGATMSQLPPHYRQALEWKYVTGRSVRDIAAALGMSEKAVESQLTRARKAFRAAFGALARNLEPQPGG